MLVALASLLTGAVLGLRFRVYVLVPAFVVACITAGIPPLVDHDALTAAWHTAAAVLLLQAGYLAGIVTRVVIAAARCKRSFSASLERRSRPWPIRRSMSLRDQG